MIIHGNKKISEIVYARKSSDGGGTVAISNIIRGAQVVFGGLAPNVKWLKAATRAAIIAAFGQTDGNAVINATNAYLNAIAATDQTKATALAGFINEDPMLVCSLGLQPQGVQMPIRWLVGDGTAWIDAGFYATQNTTAKAQAKLLGISSASSYQAIFGARAGDKNRGFDICLLYPDKIYFDFSNTSIDTLPLGPLGTIANVEMSSIGGWLNEVKVFNSSTTAFTTPSKVAVFGRTDGGVINTRPLNGAISYVEFGGDTHLHLLPFIRQGANGMIDTLTGTFYPNANTSGSFSIEYTLPDGTPWTPLNQTP